MLCVQVKEDVSYFLVSFGEFERERLVRCRVQNCAG